MNISEEMVKEIIVEVLQQMQKEGELPGSRNSTFRLFPSGKSAPQNPVPIETRWSSECLRHSVRQ